MSSNTQHLYGDGNTIHTFFQAFLGVATFGVYTQFILTDVMNTHIQKQKTIIEEMRTIDVEQKRLLHDLNVIHTSQKKTIERLEMKLNTRWWW